MKKIMKKKVIAMVMTVMMILVMSTVSLADTSGEAGQTVSVSLSVSDIYGMDGSISYSNSGLFSSISPSGNLGGSVTTDAFYLAGASKTTATVTLSLTISPSASAGDSCTITFSYETSDENGNMSSWQTQTATVTVKAAETSPASNNGGGGGGQSEGGSQSEDSSQVEAPVSSPAASPAEPAVKIDYSALEKQIAAAEALYEEEYTKESWEAVEDALQSAKKMRSSKNQTNVDDAADALEAAIKALVEMDYSALEEAMDEASNLTFSDDLGLLWNQLLTAMDEAADLLTSGDQAAVDAKAEEIHGLIDQIQAKLEELNTPVIQEVEVTKEVEVLPEGSYCNIPSHKVWPILFFISAALNVALIVIYLVIRKKNQKDDTPLVDYNIDDDDM